MIRKAKPIEILVRPTLSMLGEVKHEVRTIKELNSWVVKILVNGKVNQAQRVFSQGDLALATRTMFRTEQVLGNTSAYTRASTQGVKPAHSAHQKSSVDLKVRPVMA